MNDAVKTSSPYVDNRRAIFSKSEVNSSTELAFKYAVHTINRDKGMLPDTTLMYDIQYVDETDSFHACKKGTHVLAYKINILTLSWLKNIR
uniref:Receptor ligand binding region domain-containing protein n=1 Tax=Glossina morsitans morsitans TaxID=37546 RepID=A0A1B0FMF4_GLOMM